MEHRFVSPNSDVQGPTDEVCISTGTVVPPGFSLRPCIRRRSGKYTQERRA
jgi:hypothetical protein